LILHLDWNGRRLASWLGEDPENWPVLRLTLITPWQESSGSSSADTPEGIRTLTSVVNTAHAKCGLFGGQSPD
jgi:hypothetical protein